LNPSEPTRQRGSLPRPLSCRTGFRTICQPAQRGKYAEAYDHARKIHKRGLEGIVDFLNQQGENKTEDEVYPSRTILRRIATEGRKFGFGLCVISQRPSRLDATAPSQCNSQLILKIVNPNDQMYIRLTVESLAQSDLLALPDLSQGQALLSGAMVPSPSLVKIRIRESSEGIPAKDRLKEVDEFYHQHKSQHIAVTTYNEVLLRHN